MHPHVTADLADTPYTFVRRLTATDIVLAYDDLPERWRRTNAPNVTRSSYVIRVAGKTYRFAERLRRGVQ